MKRVILYLPFVLFAALFYPSPAAALDCPNASTQMEMNACARQDQETADAALDVALNSALAFFGESDQAAAKALKQAQDAWSSFRDSHCKVVGLGYAGGSIQPLVVSNCKADLARERMEQILLLLVEK